MRSAVLIVLLLTILAPAQRRQAVSMTGWYKHANFYQSQDARVLIPNPQTKQLDLAYQFTPDYELALGNQAYQQVVQSGAGVVNDPEVQAYFERLIQKLTSATPGGPSFPYRITILNAPEVVNAVTPPGHVIVYTGLVNKVESEAELVAVLAHEIAHNYAHHVVRQIGKQAYTQASINALVGAVQRKNAAVQASARSSAAACFSRPMAATRKRKPTSMEPTSCTTPATTQRRCPASFCACIRTGPSSRSSS
jgi:predicted Zn-dependent protease